MCVCLCVCACACDFLWLRFLGRRWKQIWELNGSGVDHCRRISNRRRGRRVDFRQRSSICLKLKGFVETSFQGLLLSAIGGECKYALALINDEWSPVSLFTWFCLLGRVSYASALISWCSRNVLILSIFHTFECFWMHLLFSSTEYRKFVDYYRNTHLWHFKRLKHLYQCLFPNMFTVVRERSVLWDAPFWISIYLKFMGWRFSIAYQLREVTLLRSLFSGQVY